MLQPYDIEYIKKIVAEKNQIEERAKDIISMLDDSYNKQIENDLDKLRNRY